jgi:hypothetical protein
VEERTKDGEGRRRKQDNGLRRRKEGKKKERKEAVRRDKLEPNNTKDFKCQATKIKNTENEKLLWFAGATLP